MIKPHRIIALALTPSNSYERRATIRAAARGVRERVAVWCGFRLVDSFR